MYQVHRTKLACTSDVHAHRTSFSDKEIKYLLENSNSDIATSDVLSENENCLKKKGMAVQRTRRKTAVQ
jgi:hypothetical protein